MKNHIAPILCLLLALLLNAAWCSGQELKPIQLPQPRMDGGKPLMQALRERQTLRSFNPEKLPPQTLSDLLWAAFGINRPDSGKRTAPSARNWQEIDLYVAMAEGLYLYDAKANTLQPALARDIRADAGRQPFVKDAPVVLIFVADYKKMDDASDSDKMRYSGIDTGFISQNVYLFCSSEDLATVVLGMVNRPALAKTMGLRPSQQIILSQPVGKLKK
ncbi:MAG: nitroreductase family protein [Verrucomicrobiae bacterium]|nr:nitroreductase family protein [Verrucomicrobiae bacterium]